MNVITLNFESRSIVSKEDVKELNNFLQYRSYLSGYSISEQDTRLALQLANLRIAFEEYPHVQRWRQHILHFLPQPKDMVCTAKTSSADPTIIGAMTTEDLAEQILAYVDSNDLVDTFELADLWSVDHQKIVGALKSLEALGDVVRTEQILRKKFELTEEGTEIADHGSYEVRLFELVPKTGVDQAELMKTAPNAKIGFSKAMSNKWIALDKSGGGAPRVIRSVDNVEDIVRKCLQDIRDRQGSHILSEHVTEAQVTEFKKRKLLQEITLKSYIISKGPNFTRTVVKPETDLTADMIASGSWKVMQFKQYNFDALGTPPTCGHLHPLLKVRSEFRQIFLEMGFSEMPTNRYVESSFWNFDALFQPQQHPARDAHDTFFISDPQEAKHFPQDYLERVKQVHSTGGYGSQGYQYTWKIEEAKKNLLRTHTTAVSARMLYKLAQEKPFRPAKYFSIDRVFRNESLDATHLAEFHQVEGVIADRGLSLGHLIGVLHEFFGKLGMTRLRFKPAYNPYTEPSMEVFAYHDGLKKWVEIGNSGVFRAEMLLPMGLPEDVCVIAWGLSLERPTMIKYGIDNIRDLIGPRVDLNMVYNCPMCRIAE